MTFEELKLENARLKIENTNLEDKYNRQKKELNTLQLYYDLAVEAIHKFKDIENALVKLRGCELPATKFIRDYL